MKVLPDIPDPFDRVSTDEELEQVLELLLDRSRPDRCGLSATPAAFDSSHLGSLTDSWDDVKGCEDEEPRAAEMRELTDLILRRHERTH